MEFFEKRVRPLFASKCYGCHGDKVQMGGLSLSSASGSHPRFRIGSDRKSDPENSRLYRALRLLGAVKMPPAGKLGAEEIAAVRTWIESGAPVTPTAAVNGIS